MLERRDNGSWDQVRKAERKEMKTGYQRDICTAMFAAALCTAAEIWKQVSVNG